MDCKTIREDISALLDGESTVLEGSELEKHLEICPACRAWQDAAHELTRRARLWPAPAPRPSTEFLERLVDDRHSLHLDKRETWTRVGLVVCALVQLVSSAPMIFWGHDHEAPLHVAHEMGSLNIAVAIGFLVAAKRPARSMGMVLLVGVAAGLLAITAAIDLIGGRTTSSDELPHLIVLIGWVLLRQLAAFAQPSWDRPKPILSGLRQKIFARDRSEADFYTYVPRLSGWHVGFEQAEIETRQDAVG